uniref:Uncharacterized protein LOC109687156 n=1 Tax=Castor canadensis TaxID=51338 RepID=A0A8B7ULM1_CASCN|nr:uncharacterized protein LOC109687156 [Castor canadensis]
MEGPGWQRAGPCGTLGKRQPHPGQSPPQPGSGDGPGPRPHPTPAPWGAGRRANTLPQRLGASGWGAGGRPGRSGLLRDLGADTWSPGHKMVKTH